MVIDHHRPLWAIYGSSERSNSPLPAAIGADFRLSHYPSDDVQGPACQDVMNAKMCAYVHQHSVEALVTIIKVRLFSFITNQHGPVKGTTNTTMVSFKFRPPPSVAVELL